MVENHTAPQTFKIGDKALWGKSRLLVEIVTMSGGGGEVRFEFGEYLWVHFSELTPVP